MVHDLPMRKELIMTGIYFTGFSKWLDRVFYGVFFIFLLCFPSIVLARAISARQRRTHRS